MEATNTKPLCRCCHAMGDNLYDELTHTAHFSTRHLFGLPSAASMDQQDARTMQASKEVWGKIFGTISTRWKFLDRRLRIAKHE